MPISKHVYRIKTGLKSLGKFFMLKLTLTIHLIYCVQSTFMNLHKCHKPYFL